MIVPVIEPLVGIANGVNVNFKTLREYRPGTVRVFINGIVSVSDNDDGWTELGYKRIRLKEPPLEGERVSAYYVVL